MVAALMTAACSEATSPSDEKRAAEMAMLRWVVQHPEGWTIELESESQLSYADWSGPCDENAGDPVALHTPMEEAEILLFFNCPLPPQPTSSDLAAAFSHLVVGSLPHGIRSTGWTFLARIPSSAVTEKVTFDSPVPSRLQASVQTTLHSIWGKSTRPLCQPPADGPYPEGCTLNLEHRVPLEISLTVSSFQH